MGNIVMFPTHKIKKPKVKQTEEQAKKIKEDIFIEQLVEEFDRPGNVVSWVFFNRMQNIGYTPNDLIHNRVTEEDIIQRENNLMNTYKERLWQI